MDKREQEQRQQLNPEQIEALNNAFEFIIDNTRESISIESMSISNNKFVLSQEEGGQEYYVITTVLKGEEYDPETGTTLSWDGLKVTLFNIGSAGIVDPFGFLDYGLSASKFMDRNKGQ